MVLSRSKFDRQIQHFILKGGKTIVPLVKLQSRFLVSSLGGRAINLTLMNKVETEIAVEAMVVWTAALQWLTTVSL